MQYSSFLNIIDVLGTFAFAVSGAFAAMEKKLDPFGVLIISFVTAIGGGTLRDVLVGNTPVNWLSNSTHNSAHFFFGNSHYVFWNLFKTMEQGFISF